jgi:glycerophosphoryl diester phosphodiesterase
MSKQRVEKRGRWTAGSLAAGRKGAPVHPAGRLLGYAAGLLDRAAFLRPIAHRGLHDAARARIENTAPAFLAAVQAGYGIECDLQAARDGTPMVFHDKKLDRLVAASGPIAAHTPQGLARLRYKGSDTGILSFAQLLELVDGRAPLLAEVKINGRTPPAHFLDKIARQARAYKGPIALMSFNADVVATLAKLAPRVPRGPVIGSHQLPARWWARPGAASSTAMARLLNRVPAASSFLAVDVRMLRGVRAWMTRHALHLPLFSWTIRSRRERETAARFADAPIFETYEP